MWFSQETSLAYETGIARALSDAGLLAVRKDRQKHINEIVTVSGYNGLSLHDETADSAICPKGGP